MFKKVITQNCNYEQKDKTIIDVIDELECHNCWKIFKQIGETDLARKMIFDNCVSFVMYECFTSENISREDYNKFIEKYEKASFITENLLKQNTELVSPLAN